MSVRDLIESDEESFKSCDSEPEVDDEFIDQMVYNNSFASSAQADSEETAESGYTISLVSASHQVRPAQQVLDNGTTTTSLGHQVRKVDQEGDGDVLHNGESERSLGANDSKARTSSSLNAAAPLNVPRLHHNVVSLPHRHEPQRSSTQAERRTVRPPYGGGSECNQKIRRGLGARSNMQRVQVEMAHHAKDQRHSNEGCVDTGGGQWDKGDSSSRSHGGATSTSSARSSQTLRSERSNNSSTSSFAKLSPLLFSLSASILGGNFGSSPPVGDLSNSDGRGGEHVWSDFVGEDLFVQPPSSKQQSSEPQSSGPPLGRSRVNRDVRRGVRLGTRNKFMSGTLQRESRVYNSFQSNVTGMQNKVPVFCDLLEPCAACTRPLLAHAHARAILQRNARLTISWWNGVSCHACKSRISSLSHFGHTRSSS